MNHFVAAGSFLHSLSTGSGHVLSSSPDLFNRYEYIVIAVVVNKSFLSGGSKPQSCC